MDRVRRQFLSISPRTLHYFVVIADFKSFSRAAQSLRLSQPALSRQIKRLEEQFGTELLLRERHGASLTAAGRRLYNEAIALQRQFERLSADLAEETGKLRGAVTLAVTSTAEHVMPDLLERFSRLHSGVAIAIRQGYSDEVRAMAELGHADLAVFPSYDSNGHGSSNLVVNPILTEHEYVVGRGIDSGKTYDFADLAELPLILPVRGNALRARIELLAARRNLTMNIVAEVESPSLVREMVVRNMGCTVLPVHFITRWGARGRVGAARLRNPSIMRTFMAVYNRRRGLSKAAEVMFSLLVDGMRRSVSSGQWGDARLVKQK